MAAAAAIRAACRYTGVMQYLPSLPRPRTTRTGRKGMSVISQMGCTFVDALGKRRARLSLCAVVYIYTRRVCGLSITRTHRTDESCIATESDFIRKPEVALIHFGCAALWRKRWYLGFNARGTIRRYRSRSL